MYKTIRHGENSLQYTILPQHDESAAAAAAAPGAPKGVWPPTFMPPPPSGELEPGTVIRGAAGSRRRSCLAYFGLVIVVSIMLGAIVVPVVLTTNFVTSGAGRGLKWYWPSASTSTSASALSSVPLSLSMATSGGAAAPKALPAAPSAQPPLPYVHNKATDCDEPNIEAMLDISDGLLHGGAASTTAQPDTVPAAGDRNEDDDDDYLLDDAALTNGVADDGKVFNQEQPPPVADKTEVVTTTPTTAALPTTTTATTADTAATHALAAADTLTTTAGPPLLVPVTPNIPGRKLRKPKVSRQHVSAPANRKVHAMATATATTTTTLLMVAGGGGDGLRGATADVPVITAGGQRNWISSHWPLGDGGTAQAADKSSMWENSVSAANMAKVDCIQQLQQHFSRYIQDGCDNRQFFFGTRFKSLSAWCTACPSDRQRWQFASRSHSPHSLSTLFWGLSEGVAERNPCRKLARRKKKTTSICIL